MCVRAGRAKVESGRDRIPVWADHAGHSEVVRLTPQLVDSALPKAAIVPERLDGDIDTDSVAELEAVHDR